MPPITSKHTNPSLLVWFCENPSSPLGSIIPVTSSGSIHQFFLSGSPPYVWPSLPMCSVNLSSCSAPLCFGYWVCSMLGQVYSSSHHTLQNILGSVAFFHSFMWGQKHLKCRFPHIFPPLPSVPIPNAHVSLQDRQKIVWFFGLRGIDRDQVTIGTLAGRSRSVVVPSMPRGLLSGLIYWRVKRSSRYSLLLWEQSHSVYHDIGIFMWRGITPRSPISCLLGSISVC